MHLALTSRLVLEADSAGIVLTRRLYP